MADIPDILKNLLGDNAEDKLNHVISSLGNDNSSDNAGDINSGSVSPELISQAKGLINGLSSTGSGDNRAILLNSLKPYMRENRRSSIDNAIKILNLARLSRLFMGGS